MTYMLIYPSKKYLDEIYNYDNETGKLICKNTGLEVGSIFGNGYKYVRIKGDRFLVSRVVWIMATGETPEIIDHLDGS